MLNPRTFPGETMNLYPYEVYVSTNRERDVFMTGVIQDKPTRHAGDREVAGRPLGTQSVIYCEGFPQLQHALRRENEIKSFSSQRKRDILAGTRPILDFLG